MKIPVSSRAHRNLRHAARYRAHDQSEWLWKRSPLDKGENLIGTYENNVNDSFEFIFVSDVAIYVLYSDGWDRLPYADIRSASWEEKRADLDGVIIQRNDGTVHRLPVRGGHPDGGRDAVSFISFLNAVVSDLRRESAG